ncbi:MAG: FGGY family carbohydrate kinase [Pseudomonadota bacterium]
MTVSGEIAVLDVGKTNVDLWVASADGTLLENRSTQNRVLDGPPWRHHDLAGLGHWICETLGALSAHHPIKVLIPVGHGSGGVLVGPDPEGPEMGAALPMIDYEQTCPGDIDAEYRAKAGTFEDRGSAIMMRTTHAARQLLWMEHADARVFGRARFYLNLAQYWGWWLTGVAASEYSAMGAQSHLWNVPRRRWSPIVADQDWGRLMPAFRPAWTPLGQVRAGLAHEYGIPKSLTVLTGAHDSSANFYRYLAAGLRDFTLVSTGTWVVALSREADIAALEQARGTSINADIEGHPVGGALTMAGRAFSALSGAGWKGGATDAEVLARLVKQGTMALPSFGDDDGQFPGSVGRGCIVGPEPATQAERTALALLHSALLTVACADVLKGGARLVLDGAFLKEPLFVPLVAALRPGLPTELSEETHGVVVGAVHLASHKAPRATVSMAPDAVVPLAVPGLADYAARWRAAAAQQESKDA